MKIKNLLSVIVFGGLISTVAHAELTVNDAVSYQVNQSEHQIQAVNPNPPTDESINRLIEVTKMEDAFAQLSDIDSLRENIEYMMLYITESNAFRDSSLDKQKRIRQILDESVTELLEKKNRQFIEEEKSKYALILKNNFTQQEVDAQIEFYESPIGRRIVDKQASISNQYAESLNDISTLNGLQSSEEEILQYMFEEIAKVVEE